MGMGPLAARAAARSYAVLSYTVFALATAWTAGFLANLSVAPTTVDGRTGTEVGRAVAVDALVLAAFGAHHSVMARAGSKRGLERVLPPAVERSTFVLCASLLLALLLWQWRDLPGTIWSVTGRAAVVVWAVYVLGWVITLGATFMVDHLDFAGLRQAWAVAGRSRYRPPAFTERWLYRWVRHPMMLGLVLVFWATPTMSAGHVVLAASATAYVLVGVRLEERDLERSFGERYREYAARVPGIVPRPLTGRAGRQRVP